MLRILVFVTICIAALATFDTIYSGGRYRQALWQDANTQLYSLNVKVKSWAHKIIP
jgi:hypothetical protein